MSIDPTTATQLAERHRLREEALAQRRPVELLSGRIIALADRVTALENRVDMLEAAFLEQHAVNGSIANTLNTILEVLK